MILMILNINTYANVILKSPLRANQGHIGVNIVSSSSKYGVNESILTIMKQI